MCSRSRSPVIKTSCDVETQLKTLKTQTAKEEKKYLINAKWWRQWCDYVNFESATPRNDLDLEGKFKNLDAQRQ